MGHSADTGSSTIPSPAAGHSKKNHHDLLEKKCHTLDEQIAVALAKESHLDLSETTPQFQSYVKSLNVIQEKMREKVELEREGTRVVFAQTTQSAVPTDPQHNASKDPQ